MLKRNLNISREAASGLTQAMHNRSFFQAADHVERRKEQVTHPPTTECMGYFYSLPKEEQEALVFYSTTTVRQQRAVDKQHNAEVAAYVAAKVRSSSEEELQALITEFGYGLSFFDRWQERGVRTAAELMRELARQQSTQEKLDWLREQVEMRTRGLQWVEFRKAWSSTIDENVGTVPELTEHLKMIISTERDRRARNELPESAPAPIVKRKTYKELGTRSLQVMLAHS